MTINDIMMRDYLKEARSHKIEARMREYDREVRRRLWCRRFRGAGESIAALGFAVFITALFCLFCMATPNQKSAECERLQAQAEEVGMK